MILERQPVTFSIEKDAAYLEKLDSIAGHLQDQRLKITFARLYNYLERTQKRTLEHLQKVEFYQLNQYLKIDMYSKRNLELTETIRSKGKKALFFGC